MEIYLTGEIHDAPENTNLTEIEEFIIRRFEDYFTITHPGIITPEMEVEIESSE